MKKTITETTTREVEWQCPCRRGPRIAECDVCKALVCTQCISRHGIVAAKGPTHGALVIYVCPDCLSRGDQNLTAMRAAADECDRVLAEQLTAWRESVKESNGN